MSLRQVIHRDLRSGWIACLGSLLAVAVVPAASLAEPSVVLVSPTPGQCVGASPLPQQAAPGVAPPPLPTDVTLVAQVAESAGRALSLSVTANGVEVLREPFLPAAAGVAEPVELRIPAIDLQDGADRLFVVTATSNLGEASDEVTATVDRRPPRVLFAPVDLARVGTCDAEAQADIVFHLADALDAAPVAVAGWVEDGCRRHFRITAHDHCGDTPNTVVVDYDLLRPPPNAPQVTFSGVAEGETTLAAAVDYSVTAPPGCVEGVDATLTRDADEPGMLVDGAIITDPGQYTATVTVDPVCSDVPVSGSRHFTVVSGPAADAGGPYSVQQGETVTLDASRSISPAQAGEIVGYDWDLDNDGFYDSPDAGPRVPFSRDEQGDYQVWVRVRTFHGFVDFDDAVVRVADAVPTCDAGGPYEVAQGENLVLDGSRSRAGSPDEPILAYGWDFGDGRFPQLGNGLTAPAHRYQDEGTFEVTLTAQDIDSQCTDTASVTVRDVAPVVRNLHLVEESLREGDTAHFSAGQTSAGSAAEPLTSFSWDFGDGTPPQAGPELRGPAHVYAQSGVFHVCLTVRDTDSSASGCLDVTVADLGPTARLEGPSFALEGETCTFDAQGSRAAGEADPLQRLRFDFGDATPPVVVNGPFPVGRDLRQTHVFAQAGTLTVTLTAEDEDSSAMATHEILVEDAQPLAALALPPGGVEGLAVRLDASGSTGGAASDPIATYRWDFGDGEVAEGPDLATVEHVFPDDGIYIVAVTVEDSDDSSARQDGVVRIQNAAPSGVRVSLISPAQPEVGAPVAFEVTYEDVPADVVTALWTFGDGLGTTGPLAVQHTWENAGRYRVAVRLDDGDGGTAQAELTVTLERPGPRIDAPAASEAVEGEPWEVRIDVSPAPDGEGGLDQPVTVRFPLLPEGVVQETRVVPGEVPVQRITLRWTPGFAQEGQHHLHLDARSASGLHRSHDLRLTVADAGRPVLAAISGQGNAAEVGIFDWTREPASGTVRFRAVGRQPLGEAAGEVVPSADGRWVYVGLVARGAVGVVDSASGRLVRRIPFQADGMPPVLFAADAEVWVAGPAGRLARIDDATLKLVPRPPLVDTARPLQALLLTGTPGTERLAVLAGDTLRLHRWSAVRAERPEAPEVLTLPFRPAFLAWDAAADALLVAETKGVTLHRYGGNALRTSPARLDDRPFALPARAQSLAPEGGGLWAATPAGIVRVEGDASTLFSSRDYAALVPLGADLNGGASLALGSRGAIEQVRVADGSVADVWRGFGARRLVSFLRR